MILNKQKKYFKQKLDGVQKTIWDWEFKRTKTRMIREEIRVEYDNINSKLSTLESDIATQKENPTIEKGEIARLDDKRVLLERERDRFLQQIKSLDVEVEGSKPTEEYREGVQGINQTLDSFRELQQMLKDYIKKI